MVARSFDGSSFGNPAIYRTDVTVGPGDTVRLPVDPEDGGSDPNFLFGVQDGMTRYRINVEDASRYTVYRNGAVLASTYGSVPTSWHEWTIDWSADGESITIHAAGTTLEATGPNPLPEGGIGWANSDPYHDNYFGPVTVETAVEPPVPRVSVPHEGTVTVPGDQVLLDAPATVDPARDRGSDRHRDSPTHPWSHRTPSTSSPASGT